MSIVAGERSPYPTAFAEAAEPRLDRRQQLILGLVGLAALAIRLLYLWGQARNNPLFEIPKVDAFDHHQWAQEIAAGRGMEATPYYRAPLYYYLLGDLYRIVGPSVLWGKVAGSVMGAATSYLIARFTASLAGFRAGLLAGILAACYWPAIYFDAELLTVGLECLLAIALALFLHSASRHDSIYRFGLAGLVWGLAIITRPNFLAFAPAILAWVFMTLPGKSPNPRKWLAAAIVCIAATLAIAPVTLRNYRVAGEPILISYSGGLNFFIGNNAESNGVSAVLPGGRRSLREGFADAHRIPQMALGRELKAAEVSDYWYARSLEWIRAEPVAWLKLLLHKFRLFWSPVEWSNNQPIAFTSQLSGMSALFQVGFPWIAVLGLAGWSLLRRDWRRFFLPGAFPLIYMGTVILFFCNARYRLPVYPFLIVAAAAGMDRLVAAFSERRLTDLGSYASIAFLSAFALATNPPDDPEAFYRADAGEGFKALGDHYSGAPISEIESHRLALEYYRDAAQLKPQSPKIQLALARELRRHERQSEAEAILAEAVGRFPEQAELRLEFGLALARSGAFDSAIEALATAIRQQPAYAEAHRELGCLLGSRGHTETAAFHLGRAIDLQPDSTRSRLCLGDSELAVGEIDRAITHYRSALALEPLEAKILSRLGDAHAIRGDLGAAIPHYRRALEQNPNLPATSQNLSGALRAGGDDLAAAGILEAALDLSPRDSGLLFSLAFILASTDEPTLRNGIAALGYAERAAEVEGQPGAQTLDAQAAAYAELGRFELAIEIASRALEASTPGLHPDLAQQISTRLQLYRAHRPYRIK